MPFLQCDVAIIAGIKEHGACEMAVWAYLNSRCQGAYGQNVVCFATYGMMANATTYSRRQCIRAVTYLIEIGWIEQFHRKGHRAPWYRILHRTAQVIQPRRGDTHVTLAAAGVTPVTSRGDTHVTSKSDTGDTQRRAEEKEREELYLYRSEGPDTRGRKVSESPGALRWRQQQVERARQVERMKAEEGDSPPVPDTPGSMFALVKMKAEGISVREADEGDGDPCG